MRKAMLLIPHPDDELLVGGGMLYALAHSDEWEVKVVYSTNGDFYKHEADIRLREALEANKLLGVPEKHVIFLGYGNRWKKRHIYNSSGICESAAGFVQTYALPDHPEYCYMRYRQHNDYTRKNLKNDIASVILDEFPEVIICVNFDSHPDHRALSLLFAEAVRDILSTYPQYKPLILKKLAYENVMQGIKDYYKLPHAKTVSMKNKIKSTPILKWDDRISFHVPAICNGIRMTKNPLYMAACCHESQNIRYKMISAINADIIYWRIPAENLALTATIEVSSGNSSYLNDFKTIDSIDINDDNCALDASVWIPDENDVEKTIKFKWNKEQAISCIEFYENPDRDCDIDELLILLDGREKYNFSGINHDGSASVLVFERPVNVITLEIVILRGRNRAGFSEISLFNTISPLDDYCLPCSVFNLNKEIKISQIQRLVSLYDCLLFWCKTLLRKIWITKYVIMKHYPKTVYNKRLICVYRMYHFVYRIFILIKTGIVI